MTDLIIVETCRDFYKLADTSNTCDDMEQSLWFYIEGDEEPHYQVPAIPIEVSYFNWAIALCEMNDPQYKYGIITLYPN